MQIYDLFVECNCYLKVSAEYLCFNLGRIHLASSPPSEERVKSVIRKTVDVLCGSLISETPLPTLGLLTAFLRDLSASPSYGQVLRALEASQFVQQVVYCTVYKLFAGDQLE